MKFPHFFIRRPIFAAVLSILIVLAGLIAYPSLPVAQYPQVVPPTVIISASYPGATAETLAETVAAPIEEAVNGVENMIYMQSSSTGDGVVSITVTFKPGTNVDQAQVLTQNRVSTAEPRLPDQVRAIGVTVRKNSPDILMLVALTSPDKSLSKQYIANYATLQLIDRLARIPGVGGVRTVGGSDYTMRIWIDPDRASVRNLTADEIVAAIRSKNIQVAAGSVGSPPFGEASTAFQLGIQVKGRLTTPEEFGDIVIKRDADGRLTHVRDVARIELGSQDYTTAAYLSGIPTVGIIVTQLPGSNALKTAEAVRTAMKTASAEFPVGMQYQIPFDPTHYIEESIKAVQHTLVEAIILVALVVLLFLQSWRAAIIPIVAIPISLTGSMAILSAFGFSLNNLSLFGMVLAIGIVVDDAIVVVENIERVMEEEHVSAREAAHKTMDEVSGALIAIALVLAGVFIPTAFIPGISGEFYKQFALTIVGATIISAFVSLTLSPAIAAIVLKPRSKVAVYSGWRDYPRRFATWFNGGFERLSVRYGRATASLLRRLLPIGVAYVLLIGLAIWRFEVTPTGFIPAQDQGYLIGILHLPPGSSLQRTTQAMDEISAKIRENTGVAHTMAIAGFDGATFTNAPNAAAIFSITKPFGEREKSDLIADELRKSTGSFTAGNLLIVPPPPVSGIGTAGGFKVMIEDRAGAGFAALERVTNTMAMSAMQQKGLGPSFSLFDTKTPRLFADIDRDRAEQLGVPVENIFSSLNTYLGSQYINDFNFLGRTFRVTAQADAPYRDNLGDVGRLKTRSASGAMVPLAALLKLQDDSGPYRVVRFNLYPAAELQGTTAHGYSTGQSLATIENLAARSLPQGFAYEWTELAYQEKQAGNTGILVFGLAVVFVFLLLAAQYENLVLPLAVILIVPMCLLAAIVGVEIMGRDNNVLTQIGLVVLIGLAAKNAILIVEFARQGEEEGLTHREAAERAAHQRLRPIVMTSIAFILGVFPLVIGTGAGSEMRQALGIAVFFGMIGVTFFGLIFTPSFFVISRMAGDKVAEWWGRRSPRKAEDA